MSDLFTQGRVDTAELEEQSQEEGSWKPVDGDPNPRVHMIRDDDEVRVGISAVDPSKLTYPIERASTIHVLEGDGTVTVGDQTLEFGPGDVLSFAPGALLTWEFRSPFRDLFVACGPAKEAGSS